MSAVAMSLKICPPAVFLRFSVNGRLLSTRPAAIGTGNHRRMLSAARTVDAAATSTASVLFQLWFSPFAEGLQ